MRIQTKEEIIEACRAFQAERSWTFLWIIESAVRLGFRQSQIAACMGVEASSVHRWVNGSRSPRRRSQFALIERLAVWLAQAETPPRSLQTYARFMPKEERIAHFRRTLEEVAAESTRDRS